MSHKSSKLFLIYKFNEYFKINIKITKVQSLAISELYSAYLYVIFLCHAIKILNMILISF